MSDEPDTRSNKAPILLLTHKIASKTWIHTHEEKQVQQG